MVLYRSPEYQVLKVYNGYKYQISSVKAKWSKLYSFLFQRIRILKFSFFVPIFRTCDSRGGASFDPRGIIWTIFVEVH